MDILIKNREMPLNCASCRCRSGDRCLLKDRLNVRGFNYDERHSDCPLVALPEHGRLIDADKIEYTHKVARSFDVGYNGVELVMTKVVTKDEIYDMPTIVEASK